MSQVICAQIINILSIYIQNLAQIPIFSYNCLNTGKFVNGRVLRVKSEQPLFVMSYSNSLIRSA